MDAEGRRRKGMTIVGDMFCVPTDDNARARRRALSASKREKRFRNVGESHFHPSHQKRRLGKRGLEGSLLASRALRDGVDVDAGGVRNMSKFGGQIVGPVVDKDSKHAHFVSHLCSKTSTPR